MDTYLSTFYRLLQVLVVFGICVSLTTPVHAQTIDETPVSQQLRELKELCDDGLISPEVCIEKQRKILELDTVSSNTPTRASDSSKLSGRTQASKIEFEHIVGLSFMLQDDWLNITPEELQAGFDFLENQLQDEVDAKRQFQQLESATQVNGTRVFSRSGSTLLVNPQISTLQLTPAAIQDICQRISNMMSTHVNRVIYDCGLREVAGYQALYIEHDAFASDARTMMYMAAIGPAKTVQIVLDSKNQSIASSRQELGDIVASLKWD